MYVLYASEPLANIPTLDIHNWYCHYQNNCINDIHGRTIAVNLFQAVLNFFLVYMPLALSNYPLVRIW